MTISKRLRFEIFRRDRIRDNVDMATEILTAEDGDG